MSYVRFLSAALLLGLVNTATGRDLDTKKDSSRLGKIVSEMQQYSTEKGDCGPIYIKEIPNQEGKEYIRLSYAPNNTCKEISSYLSLFYFQGRDAFFLIDGDALSTSTGISGTIDGNLDLGVNMQLSKYDVAPQYFANRSNVMGLHHWFLEEGARQNGVELDELSKVKLDLEAKQFYQKVLDSF